jgi:hypothetical protein
MHLLIHRSLAVKAIVVLAEWHRFVSFVINNPSTAAAAGAWSPALTCV